VPIGVQLAAVTDKIFPSGEFVVGTAITPVDYNNSLTGDDVGGVSYTCTYDQVIDTAVSAVTSCNLISGLSFDNATGILSGTPEYDAVGSYELKVVALATNGSTDSDVFTVQIASDIITANLLVNYSGTFSYAATPSFFAGTYWYDQEQYSNGVLSGGTTWNGAGSKSDPYRLSFDGTDGLVNIGGISTGTKLMVDFWASPASAATASKVVYSNGGLSGTGVHIEQSSQNSGQLNLLVGNYASVISNLAPIAHYKLDETLGTTLSDSTAGINHATLTGGSPLVGQPGGLTGDSGKSLQLVPSSTNQVLAPIAGQLSADDTISMSIWVNLSDNSTAGRSFHIFSSSATFSLFYDTNLSSLYSLPGGVYYGSLDENRWYHIAYVKTGSTSAVFYVDGEPVIPTSGTPTAMPTLTGDISFGCDFGCANWVYSWPGYLDDIAVFDYDLTAAQVGDIYMSGRGCHSEFAHTNGTFDHIGTAYDGTTLDFVVNGHSKCSVAVSSSSVTSSTNDTLGSTSGGTDFWAGDIAQARIYSDGTAANVKTNFDATANQFRETPIEGVVTDNLLLQLDPANAVQGMRAYADSTCADTVTWPDLSPYGHNPTLGTYNVCGSTDGWHGTGATGDPYRLTLGTKGYAYIPDFGSSGDYSITMEFWAKGSSSSAEQLLYSDGGGCGLSFNRSGNLQLRHTNSYLDFATPSPNDGEWHHIVMTGDVGTTTAKAYVDGVKVGSDLTFSRCVLNPLHNHYLYSNWAGSGTWFQGAIGYTAFYDRALTSVEVVQNFNALADRFRTQPLTGIVKDGLVLQLDAANAKDELRGNADGTCTETTWPDLSGNGNDGTLTNFAGCDATTGWNGDGTVGDPYALTLDGSDDFVSVSGLAVPSEFSVGFWINPDANQNSYPLSIGSNSFYFVLNGSVIKVISPGLSSVTLSSGTAVPNSTWTHIMFTYTGETKTIYFNGVAVASEAATGTSNIGSTLLVGAVNSFGGNPEFNGDISYVSYYNRALSVSEISTNCNALESRFTASNNICN
jgi:hypothetical protein